MVGRAVLAQHTRRALVLSSNSLLTAEDFGLSERDTRTTAGLPLRSGRAVTEADLALKRELLLQLESHRGNVSDVAQAMGKKRMQVHRWMRRFGVQAHVFRTTSSAHEE